MPWLVTGEQMQKIDRQAIESLQVPGLALMEAAAVFAAGIVVRLTPPGARVTVVCGAGNNGGDGWAVARHLAAREFGVHVLSACEPELLQGDARKQFELYNNYGLPWSVFRPECRIRDCDTIVDALLGTGFEGALREETAAIIAAINQSPAPVIAVDIPSGLWADARNCPHPAVLAAATASFGLAKLGLYTPLGRSCAGEIFVDPIGLPAHFLKSTGIILNDCENAGKHLPRRRLDSHKGSYGHGLLVAGSRGMSGAAMLAAMAALRSGIGLLSVACPSGLNSVLEANLFEALTIPLPETDQGSFGSGAATELASRLATFQAAAIGPGFGRNPKGGELLALLLDSPLPLVIDADGLNLLTQGVPHRQGPTIISPHPGEMAPLLGITIEQVLAEPLAVARDAADQWQCVVLLKGATTYIAEPQGLVAVNVTGTDGLATGGSGDVLTGLMLGLLSQGSSPFGAACCAAWLLGRASELALPTLGSASQLPRDIIEFVPRAVCQLAGYSTG